MAPSSKPAKKTAGGKKEKVFHPSSRKAGQLARKALRTDKLKSLASKRREKNGVEGVYPLQYIGIYVVNSATANVYAYFYHMMPDEGVLTLPQLHEFIRDGWLSRHDEELAAEKAKRRPGRPKSKREAELEDEKLREAEEYRTGIGERPLCPHIFHKSLIRVVRCCRGHRPYARRQRCPLPEMGPERGRVHRSLALHPYFQWGARSLCCFSARQTRYAYLEQ